MSNRDNFAGGFLLGTIVGGVVGGLIGALVASSAKTEETLPEATENNQTNKRSLPPTSKSMEMARRGLEDKIAQLNVAIDDVQRQLRNVNGTVQEAASEQPMSPDA